MENSKEKLLKKLKWWGIPLALVGGLLASSLLKKGIEQYRHWRDVANVREAVEEGGYTKLYQLLQSSRKNLNKDQWNKLETKLDGMICWPGVNPENYTLIPQKNIYIGKKEDLEADYNTWHRFAEHGFLIPPLDAFMIHYKNVSDAIKGKTTLQNGLGNPISKAEIEHFWALLSGKRYCLLACQTSLDAHFVEENDSLYLETEHRIVTVNGKKELKAQRREPLEKCVMEDCYVDLEFNRQGLPISKAKDQEYKPGENIFYKYPRKGSFTFFDVQNEYHCINGISNEVERILPWIGASLECDCYFANFFDSQVSTVLPCVESLQVSIRNIVKDIDDASRETLSVQTSLYNICDNLAKRDQDRVIQGLDSLLNENAVFEINKGTRIFTQYLDTLFSAEACYIEGYDFLSSRVTTLVPIIHKSLELAEKMNIEKKQDYVVQLLEAYGKIITRPILYSELVIGQRGYTGNWGNGVPNRGLRGTSSDPEVINRYHNPRRHGRAW